MIENRLRVSIARVLLPFITVWLSVIPQQAFALIPAGIGGYGLPSGTVVSGGGAAAAVGAVDLLAGAALVGIGAAIGYYAVDYMVGGDTYSVRIPTGADPAAIPPPNAAPSTGTTSGMTWGGYDNPDDWCGSVAPTTTTYGCGATRSVTLFTGYGAQCVLNYSSNPNCPPSGVCACESTITYGTEAVTCSAGYTLSGSSCVLNDARTASPDHNCDYGRSGSSYASVSDPDCGSAPMPVTGANGELAFAGVGPNGEPARVEVTPEADGGSCVKSDVQTTVGGQTVIETTVICTDADGNVISTSTTVHTGTVPTDGTAPTQGTEVSPVEFPSDYARTGEAATAANTLAPKIDRIGDALTTTVTTTDPVEPLATDMPWFGNTFSSLSGWTLPGHVSTCPQPTFDLSFVLGAGQTFVMSDHCTLFQDNQTPMRSAAIVGWLILALFVFLRA
jgi:hypothetical protein